MPQNDVAALLSLLVQTDSPSRLARQWMVERQAELDQAFAASPIALLVHQRADQVDTLLTAAWTLYELDIEPLALIAVGGYGRRELHPASDIDLLLLSREDLPLLSPTLAKVEAFIAFLWDTGFEVGHSVRSLEHAVELARTEITVATNIMEARTLTGDSALLQELVAATAPDRMWSVATFFAAKRDEQIQRHRKFNDTEYNLEPDLKRAPGGLRDIQTITWVTRRYFGAETLEQLVATGFLTERELSYLVRGRDLLWRIRWLLHTLAGRNENRLLFDHQREVATRLGYLGDSANLAVEQLMRDYYRAALAISVLNELLLQLFEEAILEQESTREAYPLNRHYQLRNHHLEAVSQDLFEKHPEALLEAFLLQAQNTSIQGLRAVTIRQMFEARHCIDTAFREKSTNAAIFMALLRSAANPYPLLLQMKRYGLLAQYLPEFGRVIGMMQYDLFHIYTVDTHTLLVVRNLYQLRQSVDGQQLSPAAHVLYRLPKPELLYVAGLYHDIAKGRGGDHSELGASDAADFCRRHGLSRWDTQLVIWLVRNHLLMSVTAQRKDISDPEVVYDFARQVGDLVHLDYLYVLTIADISATNPTLWNSWRDSLLRQLHTEATRALRRGLDNPINKQDWIDETRENALRLLTTRGISLQEASALLASLGDDYFLRETAEDIAWHGEAILQHRHQAQSANEPLVLIRDAKIASFSGGTQIFVYTPDNKNLFAATVNALDHLGLTIVDARIITSTSGFSLDTYIVLDEKNTPIGDDKARLAMIREQLARTLRSPEEFGSIVERRLPRRFRHFNVPTEVIISNDLRNDCTVVDIQTLDHPGLLAHIGRIFMEFNLLVQNARIATLGERAEDVFFVTDQQGKPLADPELGLALRERLQHSLDQIPERRHSPR